MLLSFLHTVEYFGIRQKVFVGELLNLHRGQGHDIAVCAVK